ncbi:hypothetical protein N665_0103s0033 [Sinapis alba]|nr:hypothetical protein N665_0103s0033 [Sinapis alba]
MTGHPNKTQGWNRQYFFIKSRFDDLPREDFRVLSNFRIVDHLKVLDYPDGFFDNARAVAALNHQRWPDISEERIRRQLAHILRDYWTANLPCSVDSGKKRLHLFSKKEQTYLKRSTKIKELPDLSALLGGEMDRVGPNPMGFLPDPPVDVHTDPIEEDKPLKIETTRPKRQSKRRYRNKGDAPDTGKDSAPEGPGDVYAEEHPKNKKKKKKSHEKTQGGSVSGEEPITHSKGYMNRVVVPEQDISSDEPLLCKKRKDPAEERGGEKIPEGDDGLQVVLVAGEKGDTCAKGESGCRDRVKFSYVGDSLLISDPVQCAELVCQVRSGPESLSPVDDLIFREAYARSAHARSVDTLIQLGQSEELLKEKEADFAQKEKELREELSVALADKDRAIARREVRKRKMEAMGVELAFIRAAATELEQKNAALDREKAALEKEKADLEQERSVAVLRFLKETTRLKESRSFEVTQERVRVETAIIAKCNRHFERICDHQSRWGTYETARNLYGQASSTKKCLQKLIEQVAAIPQSMVDLFTAQERQLESEAAALEVGEIPEEDLSLSPLILPPRFLDEHILAGLDPHGSNVNLVDSATIASLQAPSDPMDPCAVSFMVDGDASARAEEETGGGGEGRVGADDFQETNAQVLSENADQEPSA